MKQKLLSILTLLVLCVTGAWGADGTYVPQGLRTITARTVVYCTDITAAGNPATDWVVVPTYGTTDVSYAQITSATDKGNPQGLTDALPSTASSVKMIQIKSDGNTFSSDKRVIHMHVKGITGVIAHGNTGSSKRGLAISCTEYVSGSTSKMDESSHHYDFTRPSSGGSLICQVTGLNSAKEYIVSIYASGGDTRFYAAEFIPALAPTISAHPADANYVEGTAAEDVTALSVSATGTGTLYYQWFSNTTKSTEGAVSVQAKSSKAGANTYKPSAASAGTTYYYCAVTDDNGTANSNFATINVSAPTAPTINVTGAGNVARGGELTLEATVTAVPDITYIKWYACDSEGTISGNPLGEDLTYAPSTSTVGTYYYRAVVNNGIGGDASHDVYSDVQTINVLPQAPTFTPATGAIFAGNTVTLSSADEGTIYYTTDGSEPTAVVENLYSEPITVNEAMTIKAIAVKSGLSSTTASAAYTIKDVATPVISKKGLVVSGTQVTITSTDGNVATIYYTLDGSDPKTSDTKQTYSAPISITSSCTLNAVAKVNSTFSKSASASFTIGNADQYSYVYGSSKTSPSGDSFTVPEAENPTTVEIIYYTSSSKWTDNKNATLAYFQGYGNPTYTDGIPTGGAYMKLTPSNDGTITFIGYSGATKTYYVKKDDGTQLKTGKTPSSSGLYEINFDVEKNVVYYVYVDASKIMFHGLTFTTKFNSIDVKVGVNGWTSYISNQNLDFSKATPSGLTAYAAIYGEENITLNNVTEVPANKGLVLRGTANTTYTVPILASTEASVTTDLKGNATSDYAVDQTNNNYYVLANVGGEEGFYEYTGTAAIPAGKAFFEVAAGGAKFLPIIISEDETDGIKSVQGSRFTVNGEAYNLSGQRVGKDYKGIVIVNGKKVIRK